MVASIEAGEVMADMAGEDMVMAGEDTVEDTILLASTAHIEDTTAANATTIAAVRAELLVQTELCTLLVSE